MMYILCLIDDYVIAVSSFNSYVISMLSLDDYF